MRSLGWIALCGTLMLAVGCGGENRTNIVNSVNEQLSDANTKLKALKDKIGKANENTDKTAAEKELKEAAEMVKELQAVPQALQQILVKNSRRAPLSDEEKKSARSRGATNLNETLKELNKSVVDLEKELAAAKAKYPEKTKELNEKIETAMSEFRNLGSQQK